MNLSGYISRIKGDRALWSVILFLTFASIMVIFSSIGALAFRKQHGNTFYYLFKQLLFQLIGFTIMLLMIKRNKPIDIYGVRAFRYYAVAIFCILIGYVIGREDGGSGRTIPLLIFSFQPAELAKVAIVIWVAKILAGARGQKDKLTAAFWLILSTAGIMGLLLMMVNFSSTVLVLSTAGIMMFVARVKWKLLAATVTVAFLLLVSLYLLKPYLPEVIYTSTRLDTVFNRVERMFTKSDRTEDGVTQEEFAKIAIYRGGILGVGPGNSDISNRMSAAYNDFVYAIIVEEYGLVGGALIILAYLVFLTRGLAIIRGCKKDFPLFLATGMVTLISLQALVNMFVSAGPGMVTGQPLPWVSWGGSSQIFTGFAFGMILRISSDNKKNMEQNEEIEPVDYEDFEEDDLLLSKIDTK